MTIPHRPTFLVAIVVGQFGRPGTALGQRDEALAMRNGV